MTQRRGREGCDGGAGLGFILWKRKEMNEQHWFGIMMIFELNFGILL